MAVKEKTIEEKNGKKFGSFREDTGGGTPVGESKYPGGKGRGGYEKVGKPGHREEDQPRTEDGKFTYNAANGKPLKEISKVNGKSRGTTVNPALTGGINGVHYKEGKKNGGATVYTLEEIKEAFPLCNDAFDKKTEIVGFDGKIKVAPVSFFEAAQTLKKGDEKKWGPVADQLDNLDSFMNRAGLDVSKWEGKKGRTSKEAAKAIQEAKEKGTLGKEWVKDKYGEKRVSDKSKIDNIAEDYYNKLGSDFGVLEDGKRVSNPTDDQVKELVDTIKEELGDEKLTVDKMKELADVGGKSIDEGKDEEVEVEDQPKTKPEDITDDMIDNIQDALYEIYEMGLKDKNGKPLITEAGLPSNKDVVENYDQMIDFIKGILPDFKEKVDDGKNGGKKEKDNSEKEEAMKNFGLR